MLAHRAAQSKFEPPAAERALSLAESFAVSPRDLLTECEKSEFRASGKYSEVLDLLDRLARKSRHVRVLDLGETAEGRPLRALAISRGETRKPVILVQSAVHGGESAGKDAALIFARDLALGRFSGCLERCTVLMLPVFNADGHERRSRWRRGNQNGPAEAGARTTAQWIDLNRDYVKADAPEMRAWLRFYNAWLPHLLIDNHTSNGIDFQYDITCHIQTRQMVWKTVAAWNRAFERALFSSLEADGHIAGPYFEIENPPDFSGLRREFRTPGYSWGYASAQNRSAIVAESHSLKRYRTQVWAHYDLMRRAVELASAGVKGLANAVRLADHETPHAKRLFLNGEFSGKTRKYLFRGLAATRTRSAVTGSAEWSYQAEPRNTIVSVLHEVRSTAAPRVPLAYLIPPAWRCLTAWLDLHGVQWRVLKRPLEGLFEAYRLDDEHWTAEPISGRHRLDFRCRAVRLRLQAPAGSVLATLNQRAARMAMHLLEPEAPESLARWGWFDGLFAETEYLSDHVLIPLAGEMLASNAEVRRDFARRLRIDQSFRKNPQTRLNYFYKLTPFAQEDRNLYPILRLIQR